MLRHTHSLVLFFTSSLLEQGSKAAFLADLAALVGLGWSSG